MKIKIYDSREECLVAGAWAFMRYALNHENPVIGVCTGTTTEPIHRIVAEMYKKNPKEYEAKAREWVRLYAQEGMITDKEEMVLLFLWE